MRRFYFDLVTPTDHDRDELGVVLDSLDEAYLEACRAIVEIARELLLSKQGGDPNGYRFEIYDQDRTLVLEAPFREVLNPGAGARVRPMNGVVESVRRNIARSQELKAGISAELDKAQRTARTMASLLGRADASGPQPGSGGR